MRPLVQTWPNSVNEFHILDDVCVVVVQPKPMVVVRA
jgi:hypothetical protein